VRGTSGTITFSYTTAYDQTTATVLAKACAKIALWHLMGDANPLGAQSISAPGASGAGGASISMPADGRSLLLKEAYAVLDTYRRRD
jgi:hypothetical protein